MQTSEGAVSSWQSRLAHVRPNCAEPCAPILQDKWGFQMTARHEMYAELLQRYIQPDFRQQIIRDASG